MIRGLLTFGLACEIPGMNDELFIPWFLHSELKPEEKEELFPNVPPKDKVSLSSCHNLGTNYWDTSFKIKNLVSYIYNCSQ